MGLETVGINDNFFELGGDSILTIQVVSRMRRLGHTIQPKDIFNYQTIGGLSEQLSRGTEKTSTGEQGLLKRDLRAEYRCRPGIWRKNKQAYRTLTRAYY